MKPGPRFCRVWVPLLAAAGVLAGCLGGESGTLRTFRSDEALIAFLSQPWEDAAEYPVEAVAAPPPLPVLAPESPALAVPAAPNGLDDMGGGAYDLVDTLVLGQVEITNVQEAGVDEGGIVKAAGDYLVVLRRGRLSTISTRGGLSLVDQIDAYPSGVDASGDWYDEMLLGDGWIIVIGYSYARGGTEINRFRLGADGRLTYDDSYQLKSDDYYSGENYASRLVGDKLYLYAPIYLWGADSTDFLPSLRRWQGSAEKPFERIVPISRIYYPEYLGDRPNEVEALHTLIACDVFAADMGCTAAGMLGPESRTFYVSQEAVYLWLSDWYSGYEEPSNSLVYRLPLDGGRPGAVLARGAPVDQFSFRENPDTETLDVFVRSEAGGDAMWLPWFSDGDAAVVSIPIADFRRGREVAPNRYRELPLPKCDGYDVKVRFHGDTLLYGFPDSQEAGCRVLHVTRADGAGPVAVTVPHAIERIEILGPDAIVVGEWGDKLGFSTVELDPDRPPHIGLTYAWPEASQSESRSHAYFYRPDAETAGATGLIGLPVVRSAGRRDEGSAAVVFVRRASDVLSPAGELASSPGSERGDDGCVASCVDWYGDARPIFMRERIFGLLGYELVEGELRNSAVRETARLNFAPDVPPPAIGALAN